MPTKRLLKVKHPSLVNLGVYLEK